MEVRGSSTSAWFHFSNYQTEMNMEEEKLILSRERKSQSRPRSSPSVHDTSIVVIRRPATAASRVINAGDPPSYRGQNAGDSLQARNEIKEKAQESGEKPEALIHDDVRTSKVDEGWTEGIMALGGEDNAEIANYNPFTQINEQIPYESPPRYCKNFVARFQLLLYAFIIIIFPAVDYSSIRHLLELTEGETDLDSDKEIPDIFSKVSYTQSCHCSMHASILITQQFMVHAEFVDQPSYILSLRTRIIITL